MPLVFALRASYLDDVDLIRPDNMAAQLVTGASDPPRLSADQPGLAARARRRDPRRAGRRLLRHLC